MSPPGRPKGEFFERSEKAGSMSPPGRSTAAQAGAAGCAGASASSCARLIPLRPKGEFFERSEKVPR